MRERRPHAGRPADPGLAVDHDLLNPRGHLPDEPDDPARVVGGRQDVVVALRLTDQRGELLRRVGDVVELECQEPEAVRIVLQARERGPRVCQRNYRVGPAVPVGFGPLAREVLEEHQPFTVKTAFRVWIGRTRSAWAAITASRSL